MKQLCKSFFASILLCSFIATHATNVYKQEFVRFKQSEEYLQTLGNKNLENSLSIIQEDITTFQHMPFLERLAFKIIEFTTSGGITVTPERMPLLYAYIDNACKSQNMKTPTIFITKDKNVFNAFGSKILSFGGFIYIGQQLLNEVSDTALEAVIAHEMGHLKHNHSNKYLLLGASLPLAYFIYTAFINRPDQILIDLDHGSLLNYIKHHAAFSQNKIFPITMIMSKILFSKNFERQADEFAYKTLDRGDGLVEFLELHTQKEKLHNQGFTETYTLLQERKNSLNALDRLDLTLRFWIANLQDYAKNVLQWLTYPSDEARIAAVREYQASLVSTEAA